MSQLLVTARLTLVLIGLFQNGKALCDRYISVSKAKVIDYVNSGGNARTEGEMKVALDAGKGSGAKKSQAT